MTRRHDPTATEVDAYVFIKEKLRALGWDTRNPARIPTGQVYTQNECLSHPEIKRLLVLGRPENVVKVTEKVFWVIEAKRSHSQLSQAIREAEDYARTINKSHTIKAAFISGVAGNELDTFLLRTRYYNGSEFVPVEINSQEITGLLSLNECDTILQTCDPNITNPPINEAQFISRAEHINEILHLGAVNPHQRASVMAALLLSKLSSTGPNVEERSPSVLINDINSRVKSVLRSQRKAEFEDYIRITLPPTEDNHVKFRKALIDTIQELDLLNIRSAMNSGADWLGAFYEVFLKYASWAQDLGIVLTPRHITRFVASVMSIRPTDLVYDPTCGTGGFLVSAFDAVKKTASPDQLRMFKRNSIFGIEQDSGIAALAVVNMIFRGDGKNNIYEGNCFAKFLKKDTHDGGPTAKFVTAQSQDPPITKVMMNPPFALKRSNEKEFKFIEQALKQMTYGSTLFSILPYSAMVRPGAYHAWRKNLLLPNHTLLAVVTFAGDLFYPVGVTSLGIFVKKGVPHDPKKRVLWIRALNDGLLKSKGKRLPNAKATNDIERVEDTLKAFLDNPAHRVENVHQFLKACPIDMTDPRLELVPEAYLDQAEPTHDEVLEGMKTTIRETLAYLIKINRASLRAELLTSPAKSSRRPECWKSFPITDLFDLRRGNFHSIAELDAGEYPTISRVSTDNGLVGFYERPERARIWEPGTISVSTVTGDAFVQPVRFIATDNVVLCLLKEEYRSWGLPSLFFVQHMINLVKWRYSYGRQCYKTKFAGTQIMLPTTQNGSPATAYMTSLVESTPYWPLVSQVFSRQQS